MNRSSLAELESRFGRREAVILPWFIGAVAALAVPLVAVALGWMIELLIRSSVAKTLPETIQLGPRLSLSTVWLDASHGPLRGVLALMSLAVGLAFVEAISLHALYRWAIHYVLNCEIWIRRQLYDKNLAFASEQGIVGQQAMHIEATTHWIPQIRDALLAWHRTVPRHLIQASICFLLAILIHPTLMVLAAIAFVLLWRVYGLIDGYRRRLRPVLSERIHSAKKRLAELDASGPLASSVHPERIVHESFESHLRMLRDAEFKLYDCTLWKAPFLLAAVALMVSVFSFALSVQILRENGSLGVAGALTMLVLVGFGYVSILKLKKAWVPIRSAQRAASRLLELLNQKPTATSGSVGELAKPIERQFRLENVTFQDTTGQALIEEVSLAARPGMLVALIATSGSEARTVGEMILGFGKPSEGRIVWDDKDMSVFIPGSVQKQRLSVAPDGPMISGTIIENLSNTESPCTLSDIVDAVKLAGAYDAVAELQDTFSTLIAPGDDRLKNDTHYRLGIARAILRKPSLVVAQEPNERVTTTTEHQSMAALRQLTKQGSIVFLIPQRLSGLRQADMVVLFHEHRVAGIGSHLELLEKSELYRHLNYVRFSDLKDVLIS